MHKCLLNGKIIISSPVYPISSIPFFPRMRYISGFMVNLEDVYIFLSLSTPNLLISTLRFLPKMSMNTDFVQTCVFLYPSYAYFCIITSPVLHLLFFFQSMKNKHFVNLIIKHSLSVLSTTVGQDKRFGNVVKKCLLTAKRIFV